MIAQEGLPAGREGQGWSISKHSSRFRIVINPSAHDIRTLVSQSTEQTVHLFSGTRWVPCLTEGLRCVLRLRRRFGIMAEPRVAEGWRGAVRFFHSWVTEVAIRRQGGFVLAIGRNGPRWFESVGYRPDTIFPFAYFLPDPGIADPATSNRPVRVSWVGRLEREKGINEFLQALQFVHTDVSVTIAGAGSERPQVEAFARSSGFTTYVGTLKMADVPKLLCETDILILPSISTNDGWGAVISEALLCGAAVIATDRVGASICLEDPNNGTVVKSGCPAAIASAVDAISTDGRLDLQHRQLRREWAKGCLTDTSGSAYLMAILRSVYEGSDRPPAFYSGYCFP